MTEEGGSGRDLISGMTAMTLSRLAEAMTGLGGDGNDTIDGNFWYPSFASLVIIVDIER